MVVKPASVATCSEYEVAPKTEFQFSVGNLEILVAEFAGKSNVGTAGEARSVVKLLAVEYGPVPPTLVAFTRQ